MPFRAEIAATGAHDLSLTKLAESVPGFLRVMLQLMEQQTKTPPPVLGSEDLARLEDGIQSAIRQTIDFDFPETLGHLDLNPDNIVGSSHHCVFLDWAEGYFGHPFFSIEYLIQHFRRTRLANPQREIELRASYLAAWRSLLSDARLNRIMHFIPLLAVFAYATASELWRDRETMRNPRLAGYFRALVRRMSSELERLSRMEAVC